MKSVTLSTDGLIISNLSLNAVWNLTFPPIALFVLKIKQHAITTCNSNTCTSKYTSTTHVNSCQNYTELTVSFDIIYLKDNLKDNQGNWSDYLHHINIQTISYIIV